MKLAVLLDVDGTLVDSNDLHAEAWRVTLEAYGYRVPFEQVRGLIGMGGDKLLPALTGVEKDTQLGKQLSDQRQELFLREYAPRVQAFRGVRAFVERLLASGHRPVVASSANDAELEVLLARANLTELLELKTSSDDAARSKPDPDIVRAALARAGVPAQEALMIGDTPYDLKAAARAQVGFIGVRSGGYDDHALRGSIAVYADVDDLRERFEASPLRGRSR